MINEGIIQWIKNLEKWPKHDAANVPEEWRTNKYKVIYLL